MFVIIGLVALFGSIILGFTMHGGKLAALIQISEFIIIGGAAFASLLVGSGPARVVAIIKDVLGLLKPDLYGRQAYIELLQTLHELTTLCRREGMLALEKHIERPEESDVLTRFPLFSKNEHAVTFLCDSIRMLLMGGMGTYELQEMMEGDIEAFSEEAKVNSTVFAKMGDAMPGFGIVAAVLGVVITMQAINGPPEQIGEKVGAALVGTFLGILLAYGVVSPLAQAMETRAESAIRYITCLKCGIIALAQGWSPVLVVEFTRRNISNDVRPGFLETEEIVKGHSSAAQKAA